MKTEVVITLQVEGIHHWPSAGDKAPEVAFLRDSHRHIFHIKLRKRVTHSDRDVEFILWKREVLTYLAATYTMSPGFGLNTVHQFGARSCEDIAADLLVAFDCTQVEVWEDNENGAIVTAE